MKPLMNQLEALKKMTTVVADTGDIDAIKKYSPVDATTNPSLVLKAATLPQYSELLQESVSWACEQTSVREARLSLASDKLAVSIGKEISKLVPGKISTEVDARLSFDTQETISRAYQLLELYDDMGVSRDKVLIKIASTWEGIKAAEILEKEGIKCNLTLLFSFAQARACAEAGVFLISPFVGRILDWYKAKTGTQYYAPHDDPGVKSVANIYNYYKSHGYSTIVMGASFRNIEQIQALAGCDRLTISPSLLETLANTDTPLERALQDNGKTIEAPLPIEQTQFRWAMNDDAMATEKLSEGIRNFAVDQAQLEALLAKHM
ncbi:transaldolase [Alteromonas sp. KUL49]|uniref:transaldolase n=1 Tax=Alteromonas sp. KUL49 TaxID=2480798 RepID=UPI00102EF464|nr:transaldolase [Alteromonas sp. KUL49]TAP39426.1 transaldolase [Alteromonas sp. KUL49]